MPDGSEAPACIVAQAPHLDLALLQVDGLAAPPATIGDSRNARVGQVVFAAGHPWGQRGSVTAGVISAFAQARSDSASVPIIRSDVLLGPGNSGGPLVDAAGRVLGINTMIVGGDQGVAIPSHVVDAFVNEELSSGEPASGRSGPLPENPGGDWM
jgi:serine protease Do